AFHRFASNETVAEIARVLHPRGGLAIFWNIWFGETEPPMPDGVDVLLDEAFARGGAPGLPKVLSGAWREPLERSPFKPLQEAEVERTVFRDRERWLANMLSVSSIAAQSDEDRLLLATRLRELVPYADYRWRIRTVAYWTRLEGLVGSPAGPARRQAEQPRPRAFPRRRRHQGRPFRVLPRGRAGDHCAPSRPAVHDEALARRDRGARVLPEAGAEGHAVLAQDAAVSDLAARGRLAARRLPARRR